MSNPLQEAYDILNNVFKKSKTGWNIKVIDSEIIVDRVEGVITIKPIKHE